MPTPPARGNTLPSPGSATDLRDQGPRRERHLGASAREEASQTLRRLTEPPARQPKPGRGALPESPPPWKVLRAMAKLAEGQRAASAASSSPRTQPVPTKASFRYWLTACSGTRKDRPTRIASSSPE